MRGNYVDRETVFSQIMTQERNRRGLSQDEMAELIGVHRFTVIAWELGRSVPYKENMGKICKALNITKDYLLSGSPKQKWVTYDNAHRGHAYCPYCNHRQSWTIRDAEWNWTRQPMFCSWCGREVDGS